jgi:hypothetical protein
MTRTTQNRSCALLTNTGNGLAVNKPEAEDNVSLFLQVLDSMNELYEKLIKLKKKKKRKKMEQVIKHIT